MNIKNMPKESRPRERFDLYGPRALSDYEIMAIIIGSGLKNNSVIDVACEVISQIELSSLEQVTIKELEKIKGIGHITAMRIMCSLELARRVRNPRKEIKSITNAKDVYLLLKNEVEGYEQEHFIVLYLDSKCRIISQKTIFIGTKTMTLTHPREIFKYAVKEGAVGIVIVHNHPSGISKPSDADIEFTRKIFRLGIEMQIEVLDHVIIGFEEFYSFKEHKII